MSTVTAVSIVLNIGYAAMWIIGAVVSATVVVAARVGGLALTALAFTINFVVSELIPRLPGVVLATLSLAATTASWAGAVTLLLIRGLAVIAAHALALLKDLSWSLLLWVNEVSPEVFHMILWLSKLCGAALVDAAISTVVFAWDVTGSVVAALRDPATPNTPAVWEPVLRLSMAGVLFFGAVVASDAAGRHWIALRPVFVVPLLLTTVVVAFAYDDVRGNDGFVDFAGGLVVLWFCAAAAVQLYETWLGARLEEWWRRKAEENEQRLRTEAERAARNAARDMILQNAVTERDRSSAAASRDNFSRIDENDEDDKDDECPVCLEPYCGELRRHISDDGLRPFEDEDQLVLPCGHRLHASCCRDWLRTSATCPMCRHRIHATSRLLQRLLTVI